MYWRDYDLTYQADDVIWAGLQPSTDSLVSSITDSAYIESDTFSSETITPTLTFEKTIDLFSEQTLSPSIVYPLMVIGVDDADTLQATIITDTPVLKLLVEQAVNPAITKSVYIESNTATSTNLYPSITEALIFSLYGDEDLSVSIETLNPIAYTFGEDTVIPVLIDDAESIILQDTYLKRLADSSWDMATIYLKESDGSWSSKPIYMKQIDKSWM